MNQAFYTGIVGIQTHQYGIDALADNISNINTVGYKSYTTEFASLFESAVQGANVGSTLNDTVGVGSRVQSTAMNEAVGTMMESDKTSSLAINGEGWFGISRGGEVLYTRAGNFIFDAERNMVTYDGYYVMGSMGGNISNGMLTEVLDSVPLNGVDGQVLLLPGELTYPGEPSTTATFKGNVGLDAEERLVSAVVIAPDGTSNRLSLRFTQSAIQPTTGLSWDITATVSDASGSTIYDTQTGTAIFDGSGALQSYSIPAVNNNGAAVTIDLGSGYNGIISIDSDSVGTFSSTADGSQTGELVGYEVDQSGNVIVAFNNGKQSAIARVALYHFQNDQGLERVSGTRYRESSNSGEPIIYQDADGNYISGSRILDSTLESSNVRLESALTELIVMQRAYDANAKSITTGDELIQKALQMDAK